MIGMDELQEVIEKELADKYPFIMKDRVKWFRRGQFVFHVDLLGEWKCFVLEYNDGEDGDFFYPDDYDSIDYLVKDMIEEVENAE